MQHAGCRTCFKQFKHIDARDARLAFALQVTNFNIQRDPFGCVFTSAGGDGKTANRSPIRE